MEIILKKKKNEERNKNKVLYYLIKYKYNYIRTNL